MRDQSGPSYGSHATYRRNKQCTTRCHKMSQRTTKYPKVLQNVTHSLVIYVMLRLSCICLLRYLLAWLCCGCFGCVFSYVLRASCWFCLFSDLWFHILCIYVVLYLFPLHQDVGSCVALCISCLRAQLFGAPVGTLRMYGRPAGARDAVVPAGPSVCGPWVVQAG